MANFIFTDSEELARIAPDLDHPDLDRLAEYIGYLSVTNTEENRLAILTENLPKWAEWEQDSYYGTYATPEEFIEYFLDGYGEMPILDEYTVTDNNYYYANLY